MVPAGGNWLWRINQVPVGCERTGTFRLSVRLRQNNVERFLHLNGMNRSCILDLVVYLFSLFVFFQLCKSLRVGCGGVSNRKFCGCALLSEGHYIWDTDGPNILLENCNTESDESSRGSCSNHSHIYTVSVQILAQRELLFNKDIVQTALFGLFQWNERKLSTSSWQLYVWQIFLKKWRIIRLFICIKGIFPPSARPQRASDTRTELSLVLQSCLC